MFAGSNGEYLIFSYDLTHIISRFFCSKNMHRVDTENLEEEKQVIKFFIYFILSSYHLNLTKIILLIEWLCAL